MRLPSSRLTMRLLIASGVLIGATICAPAQDKKSPLTSTEAVVRVWLWSDDDGMSIEFRLTKPEVVRKLVERPLRDAAPDPNPARWVPAASVELRRDSRKSDGFVISDDWKHFKIKDEYRVSDFSALRTKLKSTVKELKDLLD